MKIFIKWSILFIGFIFLLLLFLLYMRNDSSSYKRALTNTKEIIITDVQTQKIIHKIDEPELVESFLHEINIGSWKSAVMVDKAYNNGELDVWGVRINDIILIFDFFELENEKKVKRVTIKLLNNIPYLTFVYYKDDKKSDNLLEISDEASAFLGSFSENK